YVRDAGADQRVRRLSRHVRAVEPDASRTHRHQTGDRTQQRRLAGTVATQDRAAPPLVHGQRDLVQRPHLAVVHVDPFDLEQAHRASSAFAPTPRYASIVAASSMTASGVSEAMICPLSRTTTWPQSRITTSSTCSTSTIV